MRVAVVIPVKSFALAKGRLSDALTPSERESLARHCATTVLSAAAPLNVYVVCNDADVEAWAASHGAHIVHCATPGLDSAVGAGRTAAQADGYDHVVVAHADLPLATTFHHIARQGCVTMVTDRHRDGTNVLSFPINSSFVTAYGPGSFDNHQDIARRCGLQYEVIDDAALSLDLDTADDLTELSRRKNTPS